MTSVVTKASNGNVTERVEYTYDVYDRRNDGDHIALVFDETGSETHRYLHGPQIDQVLAEETANGETHWALHDHQGSIRDVINNAGTVLNHIVYDSFGQVTRETNPTFDFRFSYTGRERDEETGLMYYRARYFDPAVGTFVSEDPLGFDAGDANIYRYVFNSPTNFTDPSGEIFWVPLIIGVVAVPVLVNLLVPSPPAQAPTDCQDFHEDEYFWPRLGAGIVVGAGLEAAASPGVTNAISSFAGNATQRAGNFLDDAARGLDDLLGGGGPRLATADGGSLDNRATVISGGMNDGTGPFLSSSGNGIGDELTLGGRHRDTKVGGKQHGTQSHHPIADNVNDISTDDAPAIRMNVDDHVDRTGNWGRRKSSIRFREEQKKLIEQGKHDEALIMGLEDVTVQNGSKYDEHIGQMLDSLPKNPDGTINWSALKKK